MRERLGLLAEGYRAINQNGSRLTTISQVERFFSSRGLINFKPRMGSSRARYANSNATLTLTTALKWVVW